MARRHVEIPLRFTRGTSGCQGTANSSSLKTSGGTLSTHTSDYNRPVTPLSWQGQDRVCSPYSPGSFSPQVPSPQLSSVWGERESEPVRASLACRTPVLLSTNQVFTDKSQPSIQIPIAQATINTIYKGFLFVLHYHRIVKHIVFSLSLSSKPFLPNALSNYKAILLERDKKNSPQRTVRSILVILSKDTSF